MLLELRPKSYLNYLSLSILGSILDDFTSWSYQRGYSIGTIKNQLKDAKKLNLFFLQQGIYSLNELTHLSFEMAWQHYRLKRNLAGTIRQIELFLDETLGLISIPAPLKTPSMLEIEHYAEYLKNVRGLSTNTIQSHCSYIQEFLKYLNYDANKNVIEQLTSKDIEDFICICSKRMNRYSLQHVVAYLRSFLRFKYGKQELTLPLYTMIDTPRTYRFEKLPRAFPWETVNRLLLSIDQSNEHGIRDYTMLHFMATYGLRASEITSLTLDDIDWKTGTIRIMQQKSGKHLLLPLTDVAGDVLIQYLKQARPKTQYRQLFLRIRAPFGPLKPTALHDILESRIRLSGLTLKYSGTHCIRHSFATHLLHQGLPLKSIGDLLGHQDTESTCVYLRLATEDLREVALSIPHELVTGIPKNIKLNDYLFPSTKNKDKTLRITSSYSLQSFFAQDIQNYIKLKKALGREYRNESKTLYAFDALLADKYPNATELNAEMFNNWSKTLHDLTPKLRRSKMYLVYNFCLYRCRTKRQTFIPDVMTFPKDSQKMIPYIFSEFEISQLIKVAKSLHPYKNIPLRPQTIRLAIILLYTTGLRRGELLRLNLSDFDSKEATLLIQNTKFHKSRILPISSSIAHEITEYLRLRSKFKLPMETNSPLILNSRDQKNYTGTGFIYNFSSICNALKIYTRKGNTPRIHDLRHTFAAKVLQRWYQKGEEVQAKLPLLATYMGHVSIVSTHYYLQFIEETSSLVSTRFYESFGKDIIDSKPQLKLHREEQ